MKRLDKPPERTTKNNQEDFEMPCDAAGSSACAPPDLNSAKEAASPDIKAVTAGNVEISGAVSADPVQSAAAGLVDLSEGGAAADAVDLSPDVSTSSRFSRLSLHLLRKTLAGRKRKDIPRTIIARPTRPRLCIGTLDPVQEEPDVEEVNAQEQLMQPARWVKSRLTHRSNPGDIVDTIKMLSPEQREEITKLGWGKFLEFNLDKLESRDLYCWLMEKIDLDTMELCVSNGKVLPITEREVNLVLGVPSGGRNIPHHKSAEVTLATSEFKSAIGLYNGNISVERLQQEIRKHRVDAVTMKCFFMIVFDKLLFPTTSHDIAAKTIRLTMDINQIGEINWCRAVVEDLRDAAYAWQTRNKESKSPSISGCATFVLLYYLDNLDHPLNNVDRLKTPRCNFFNKKKIEAITLADKFRLPDGNERYGLLELRSQVGSSYQAPSTEPVAAHVPCRPIASMQVPLMRDLLTDVLNQPTGRKNKEVAAMVRALDTVVRGNMMDICRAQQNIMDAQYKTAADIRKLLLGEETSAAANATTNPTDGLHDNETSPEEHNTVSQENNIGSGDDEETSHQPGTADPGQVHHTMNESRTNQHIKVVSPVLDDPDLVHPENPNESDTEETVSDGNNSMTPPKQPPESDANRCCFSYSHKMAPSEITILCLRYRNEELDQLLQGSSLTRRDS